MLKVTEAYK